MVVVSYSGKEINAKLVYYGAGLSGKTTNLESIYEAVPETSRGKMVSMKTQSDRTLFFDLLPLDLGEIMGFKTRFLLYTVPGQVFYNATRKLVLKGADAIVFVADSAVGKMDENKESLANLRSNLAEYGLKLEDIPWVIQANKRDLPKVYSMDDLAAALNPDGTAQMFEAVATQGTGVFETFRGISHLLMQKVTRELQRNTPGGSRAARTEESAAGRAPAPAPRAAATPPVAPPPPTAARDLDYGRDPLSPAKRPSLATPHASAGEPGHGAERLRLESDDAPRREAPRPEPARPEPPRQAERSPNVPPPDMFPDDDLEFDDAGGARRRRIPPLGGSGAVERPSGASKRFEERTITLDEREAAAAREAARESAAGGEAAGSRREVVVPITIPAGTTSEIVLRISIKTTP